MDEKNYVILLNRNAALAFTQMMQDYIIHLTEDLENGKDENRDVLQSRIDTAETLIKILKKQGLRLPARADLLRYWRAHRAG